MKTWLEFRLKIESEGAVFVTHIVWQHVGLLAQSGVVIQKIYGQNVAGKPVLGICCRKEFKDALGKARQQQIY